MKILPITIIFFFLSGHVVQAADTDSKAVLRTACGPDMIKFNAKKGAQQSNLEPKDGEALVYVISEVYYRAFPQKCSVVTRIGLDGKWLGANCGDSYLSTMVDPGEHHLCGDWQPNLLSASMQKSSLSRFTAEAGKTYYFRIRVFYPGDRPYIDLESINTDEGQLLVSSTVASISTPKK